MPALSTEEQKFMALSGLRTWCFAAIQQVERINAARENQLKTRTNDSRTPFNAERHFFIVAAWKVFEHMDWVSQLSMVEPSLFEGIEKFRADTKLLRNKNEHVTEYFSGEKSLSSFEYTTAEGGRTDASATVSTRIADRLDWVDFAQTAKALLAALPLAYWPDRSGESTGKFVWK